MELTLTDANGIVTKILDAKGIDYRAPAVVPATTKRLLKITDYGANVDAEPSVNQAAIAKCYAEARTIGADVEIPPGKFRHNATLVQNSITVYNNGELCGSDGTDQPKIGYYMNGLNPRLIGGIISREGAKLRGSQMFHHGVSVFNQTGIFELTDVTINGSTAAGFMNWGGRNGTILRLTVNDSLADGIHNTLGAENLLYRDSVVRRSGDDTLAFVTYGTNSKRVSNVRVYNHRGEDSTWARGIAIVGGFDIEVRGAVLKNIWGFGLYVFSEYNFGGPSVGIFNDVKIDKCGNSIWDSVNQRMKVDAPDGVCVGGRPGDSVTLNDCVIMKPKRHAIMQYNATGTTVVKNNLTVVGLNTGCREHMSL